MYVCIYLSCLHGEQSESKNGQRRDPKGSHDSCHHPLFALHCTELMSMRLEKKKMMKMKNQCDPFGCFLSIHKREQAHIARALTHSWTNITDTNTTLSLYLSLKIIYIATKVKMQIILFSSLWIPRRQQQQQQQQQHVEKETMGVQ